VQRMCGWGVNSIASGPLGGDPESRECKEQPN